jgi:hypothetical protein
MRCWWLDDATKCFCGLCVAAVLIAYLTVTSHYATQTCAYDCDGTRQLVRAQRSQCAMRARDKHYYTATLLIAGSCSFEDIHVPKSTNLVVTGVRNAELHGGWGIVTPASRIKFEGVTFGTFTAPLLGDVHPSRTLNLTNCTILDPDSLSIFMAGGAAVTLDHVILANEVRAMQPLIQLLDFCGSIRIHVTECQTLRCDTLLLERKCDSVHWDQPLNPYPIPLDPSARVGVARPEFIPRASGMSKVNQSLVCDKDRACKNAVYTINRPGYHLCHSNSYQNKYWPLPEEDQVVDF